MSGDRRQRKRLVGVFLVIVGPLAVVYGAMAMIGGAFGEGTAGWATALFLAGLMAIPIGVALIAAGRRH